MSPGHERQSDSTPLDPAGRIGVIGLGAFGLFCLSSYAAVSDLHVTAVADASKEALSRVHNEYPDITSYLDWHDMVADEGIEVVHIATPPSSRLAMIVAAAEEGKSVFCEKPLALTLAEADEAIRACRASGVALGIDYVMRWHPIYRFLIDITRHGLLGSVRRISLDNAAKSVPGEHWFWNRAMSGGILVEHGVHFFDVFTQMAGPATPIWTRGEPGRVVTEIAYASGGWGSFYHDFTYDEAIEQTLVTVIWQRAEARIAGWIPTTLRLRALVDDAATVRAAYTRHEDRSLGMHRTMSEQDNVVTLEVVVPDRQAAYAACIADGMRDIVRAHRDSGHTVEVTTDDARTSLALALAAGELDQSSATLVGV